MQPVKSTNQNQLENNPGSDYGTAGQSPAIPVTVALKIKKHCQQIYSTYNYGKQYSGNFEIFKWRTIQQVE